MRLGKKYKTKVPPKIENKIDEIATAAKDSLQTAGIYGVFEFSLVKDKRQRRVIIDDRFTLHSKDLYQLLKDSEKAAVFACTIGREISDRVKFLMESGNMSDAVILDAFGSEAAESCAEYMQGVIAQSMRLQGFRATRRFSPGYGDVPLSDNESILNLLEIENNVITINSSYIMSPEKSVTAILGLEK